MITNEYMERYGVKMLNPDLHKQFQKRIEEEKNALRQREKILQGIQLNAAKTMGVPIRDDLKLKELATYKALLDGDILQYEFI